MGKDIEKKECQQCGQCCYLNLKLFQHGIEFVTFAPVFVCSKLDVETYKCKIYDSFSRPQPCRDFNCDGKPHAMNVRIEGERKYEC